MKFLFLDKIDFSKPKTKEAIEIVNSLSKIGGFEKIKTKKTNKAILALDKKRDQCFQKFPQHSGMEIYQARNLNILDILKYKFSRHRQSQRSNCRLEVKINCS